MAKRARKISTPRGEARSMTPLTPYQVTVSAGGQGPQGDLTAGIIRNDPSDWFGPLNPMKPIAPPEVAGRRFDYAPGYNIATQPRSYEVIGFPLMRMLADSYDLLRIILETRKDQVARLKWNFRPAAKDARGKSKDPSSGQQSKIDELTKFFTRPDGYNRWRPWLRSVLEDVLVIDALSLYCMRSRGGKLLGLQQIDGATVKVLLDNWGRTPIPYTQAGKLIIPAAYQQTLKGFPAVDYSTRDLLYRPSNKRVHKPYGYSPVEQIIITVNIGLRRQMFNLAYYTEGNVPEALIGTPESWTPDQILAFQINWDTMMQGNSAQRRHAKFVPGGVAKTFIATKEKDLKNEEDDWLARIVCFALSVSPQQLTKMMNRATAQTSGDQAKEEGVEPLKEFVTELVQDVIETEFGVQPGEIEFAFEEEIEVDQEKQTNVLAKRVEDGAITLNEMREELGQDQSDNPAADLLMVKTATGYVPIEANTMEAKQAEIDAGLRPDPNAPPPMPAGGPPGAPAGGGGTSGKDDGKATAPKGGKAPKPKPGAKKPAAGKAHDPHAIRTERFLKAARRARRLAPVPFDRPKTKKAIRKTAALFFEAFKKTAKRVAADVRYTLAKSAADDIADDANLSAIEEIIADLGEILADSAADVVAQALAQVGPDAEADLFNKVNEEAVSMAYDMAAELVSNIDETTRDMIREVITDGLESNIGTDAIADAIQESTAFSEERASLIANTEVRNANSRAALSGYISARDEMGLNVRKEWILGENPCEICEGNADDGPIDLDDEFSSGDTEPTAHPNCECAISPVVDYDPDEADEGAAGSEDFAE